MSAIETERSIFNCGITVRCRINTGNKSSALQLVLKIQRCEVILLLFSLIVLPMVRESTLKLMTICYSGFYFFGNEVHSINDSVFVMLIIIQFFFTLLLWMSEWKLNIFKFWITLSHSSYVNCVLNFVHIVAFHAGSAYVSIRLEFPFIKFLKTLL